jgi:uncharacterized membrane protein YkvA (DUF1232 family)
MVGNWKERAKALKTEIHALLIACRDPRTPWLVKAWALFVVAYALSPIDLIPDFIPVLGYLDDLILLPLGIALAIKFIPAEVMDEARKTAIQAAGNRVGWFGTGIIVIVWAMMIVLAIAFVMRQFK